MSREYWDAALKIVARYIDERLCTLESQINALKAQMNASRQQLPSKPITIIFEGEKQEGGGE